MHSTAIRSTLEIGLQALCCTWLMYRIWVWYRILGRMLISNLRERARHENRLINTVYNIVGYNDPRFYDQRDRAAVLSPKNILDTASAHHCRGSLVRERDNGRIILRHAISRMLSSRYSPDDRNNSNHIPSFTSPFVVTAYDFGISWSIARSTAPRSRNMPGQFSFEMRVSRATFFARS